MSIQAGSTVIHNGIEKTINSVMGDVIILNDDMVVSMDDVSEVTNPSAISTPQNTDESQEIKNQLRTTIESLNENTPIASVMACMESVDPNMVINTRIDFNLFRTDILRRALSLRKIDPKTCNACGQTIAD